MATTEHPPLTRVRYWIGRRIFALSDWLEDVACWWNEMDFTEEPEETALHQARAMRVIERVKLRLAHPCFECGGRGWVQVPDGWTECLECGTDGIDPAWAPSG